MKNTFDNKNLIASVMDLAKENLGKGEMISSAELCYKTACEIMSKAWHNTRADITGADTQALKSLAYSVGMFHPDYILAQKTLERVKN